MIITHEITIDFQRPGLVPWVDVVLDDSYSRAVAVKLTNDAQPWQVPEGVTAAVRYRKNDDTAGFYDTLPNGAPACAISGSTVTVMLAPQMLTAVGTTVTDVVFHFGETTLGSFSFDVRVHPNPLAQAGLESSDYFSMARVNMAYEQLYNAMNSALAQVEKAAADAQYTAQALLPGTVDAWLQAHPEATTTVPDGAIGEEKLTDALREKLGGSGLSPLLVSQLRAFFRDMQLLLPQLAYTRTEHAGDAVIEDAAWVIRALDALDDGQVTPPAGDDHDHSYSVSVTKAASCTEPGVRTYTCSCGHSYTQSIPATGHSYAGGVCSACGDRVSGAGTGVGSISWTVTGASGTDYDEPEGGYVITTDTAHSAVNSKSHLCAWPLIAGKTYSITITGVANDALGNAGYYGLYVSTLNVAPVKGQVTAVTDTVVKDLTAWYGVTEGQSRSYTHTAGAGEYLLLRANTPGATKITAEVTA